MRQFCEHFVAVIAFHVRRSAQRYTLRERDCVACLYLAYIHEGVRA